MTLNATRHYVCQPPYPHRTQRPAPHTRHTAAATCGAAAAAANRNIQANAANKTTTSAAVLARVVATLTAAGVDVGDTATASRESARAHNAAAATSPPPTYVMSITSNTYPHTVPPTSQRGKRMAMLPATLALMPLHTLPLPLSPPAQPPPRRLLTPTLALLSAPPIP